MSDILTGAGNRPFEVFTDGTTVWVNADDGMSIGRFSRFGVDVHRDAAGQEATGRQCLACIHDLPAHEGWEAFKSALLAHYGLAIDDSFRPAFAAGPVSV